MLTTLNTPTGPVLFHARDLTLMPRNSTPPPISEPLLRGITVHWPGGPIAGAYAGKTSFDQLYAADITKVRKTVAEHCARVPVISDVGYNYLIGRSGVLFEGRGWTKCGANGTLPVAKRDQYPPNTTSSNAYHVSVQVVAGIEPDFDDLTAEQMVTLQRFYAYVVDRVGIGSPTVNGHRDVRATGCPGDVIYNRLPEVARSWPLPVRPPKPEVQPPTPTEDEDMPRLIQPENDPTVLLLDGLTCTHVRDGNVVVALRAAGIVSPTAPVITVKRLTLSAFVLVGPEPPVSSYVGAPASQDQRTKATDFAGHRPNG